MQESSSKLVVELKSLADTRKLGQLLANTLTPPATLALCGTMGSGKTELTRSIALAMGVPGDEVTSPTYVLVHRYRGRVPIYHVDLYRLETLGEVWDLGLDELFESECVTIVEWANKFDECLPDEHVRCELELLEGGLRKATITARCEHAPDWIPSFQCAWRDFRKC